jgi:hypothetical protein
MSYTLYKKNLYLIASYPRSGNHWVRYIIEYISQRPTLGADASDVPLCKKISSLKTNGKPIAIKTHYMGIEKFHAKRMRGLIVIVRNYKEALLRHNKYINNNNLKNKRASITSNYIKIIKTYHKWDGPKMMLYYEDLISKSPVESITKISDFIKNTSPKKLKNIIKNIDKHKEISVSYYDKIVKSGSVTKGKIPIFHSKKLTDINRKKWDQYIKKKWPNLYKDYLVRYKE